MLHLSSPLKRLKRATLQAAQWTAYYALVFKLVGSTVRLSEFNGESWEKEHISISAADSAFVFHHATESPKTAEDNSMIPWYSEV